MVDSKQIRATFRSPEKSDYPELAAYTRDEIYEDCMGGGALYLAARMARTLDLSEGDIVLDLGCGKGSTSIFLAEHFGVKVVAVDLWIPAGFLATKFANRGQRNQILPLNLDITRRLPFAEEYFDAVFCMNSLSFYGGSTEFLHHLLRYLKPGGQVCVGMETLNEEFLPEVLADPPPVYNYHLPPPNQSVNVWESDFSKMHSPPWWKALFRESELVKVYHCRELEDAVVLYEDLVLYQLDHDLDPEDIEMSIAQLEFGRENRPYKTLFVLAARKL